MRPDIAAIVVTHRSAETIDDCLARLRAADGIAAIRVVDNDSDDGTLEIIQRHALAEPRLRFIANPDNPGFSVACNQGEAALPDDAGLRWLAFVNPDCLVEVDTLARLREHALAAGGAILLGADLVDDDGLRDSAARRRDPDFAAMLQAFLRGSSAAGQLGVDPDDAVDVQQVDAVSGALMLLPRVLFRVLGGFDEKYRLHAEDLDLCRRARDAGASVAVANDVRVLHVRGVSSRSRPVFVEWHKHRGLWRYFRKFEAPQRGALTCAAVFALVWLRFPIATMRALMRS
ncbi:glycosyltransferase family 2 protein [Lysobacter fragariae]